MQGFKPQGAMGVKVGHTPTPLAGVNPAVLKVPGALPTSTGMRMPSPGGWAQRIWAGPSWMVSRPGCWSTMVPELTQ